MGTQDDFIFLLRQHNKLKKNKKYLYSKERNDYGMVILLLWYNCILESGEPEKGLAVKQGHVSFQCDVLAKNGWGKWYYHTAPATVKAGVEAERWLLAQDVELSGSVQEYCFQLRGPQFWKHIAKF